ncbi:MAG: hypothetical protein ACYCVH_05060 [Ignavibacteriaceae bacterium]
MNLLKTEYDKAIQTTQEPQFNHKQIEMLYRNGFEIDHFIIKEILLLPRETLIIDLENVIMDGICRFEYFEDKAIKDGWNEEEFNFLVHALYLLAELRAEESLPVIKMMKI